MNKLRKGLIGLVIGSVFAVSGCNIQIGGRDYECLYKTRYFDSHLLKAMDINEKIKKNPSLENKKEAIHAHGRIGNLNLMNKYVQEIVEEGNTDEGELYSWIGEQYYKAHKKCRHPKDFINP